MGIVTQTTAATPGTDADFGSQLQYSLTTVPDPLTVSPAGSVETGDLIIIGSRISPDPIETNEISVRVPIGTEAWQLVLDYTGMQTSVNLTGWTATADAANERILFKPSTGHATITPEKGLTLQLNKLRVNRQVGTAPVVVELKWREPGTGTWKTETQELSIGKFPAGFYLRNLKPDSAYIENGDDVTLEWDASEGATYHLLYEDAEPEVTEYSRYCVKNVRRNTMFYLRGRVQQGTGTAERTINTYVTVNRPDLEVRNLKVHGEANLLGMQKMRPPKWSEGAVAETDGMLLVSVWEKHLNIWLKEPGADRFLLGGCDAFCTIPVKKGSRISFDWGSPSAVGTGTFIWYPFGNGSLVYD
ncbi:hypothetical protein GCM10010521_24830 [Streptomyces rameus]|uniref:Uncharacterized protein n=1 Tax=Streptomyces rameus TaxID=68261 RepID=A0ABP6N6I9_9ACTN